MSLISLFLLFLFIASIAVVIFLLIKNKKQRSSPLPKETETTQFVPAKTAINKTEDDIKSIEEALAKSVGTPNEEVLLRAAGECYLRGDFGAPVDYDKALTYFKRLENLGNIEGKFFRGKLFVAMGLEQGDKMRFSQGVLLVYDSYTKGCPLAEELLTTVAESGMINNVHTLEQMLCYCQSCCE